MDSMSTAPLLTALEALHESHSGSMHTALPGIVQSYDPETQLATVLPAVNFKIPRGPTLQLSPIDNVPVMFPFTSGFRMSFPISEGDGVLLIFSEASLGNWIEGSGQVDPEDSTRFSMHDAIAIPGLWQTSTMPSLAADMDFLFASKTGARIGGTSEGKLDLSNDTTDLRSEIEKLRKGLSDLADIVKAWSPVAPPAGGATVPNPAQVLQVTTLQTGWTKDQTGLEGLLK